MHISYQELEKKEDILFRIEAREASSDEIMRNLCVLLSENDRITQLTIKGIELYKVGVEVLQKVIIGHPSLRSLALHQVEINSYFSSSNYEGYFPVDLDEAVDGLVKIFQEAHLEHIEILDLAFKDRTQRVFHHYDMVEPAVMRDILLEEKGPEYLRKMIEGLKQNLRLCTIHFTVVEGSIEKEVNEIRQCIEERECIKKENELLKSVHGGSETQLKNTRFVSVDPNKPFE